MEPILFIPIFVIACGVILFLIFKPVLKDRKARNGITNFDTTMRNYCFCLKIDEQEALTKLSNPNPSDPLEYTYNENNRVITFLYYGAKVDYQLSCVQIEGQTWLHISQISLLSRGNIPYAINSFFINKLAAIPTDYSAFVAMQNKSSKS